MSLNDRAQSSEAHTTVVFVCHLQTTKNNAIDPFICFGTSLLLLQMTPMMKVSMLWSCLLLSLTATQAYKIIPRPEKGSRKLQEPLQSPLISFDGDLDRMQKEMAAAIG